jgi:hypothetical protein
MVFGPDVLVPWVRAARDVRPCPLAVRAVGRPSQSGLPLGLRVASPAVLTCPGGSPSGVPAVHAAVPEVEPRSPALGASFLCGVDQSSLLLIRLTGLDARAAQCPLGLGPCQSDLRRVPGVMGRDATRCRRGVAAIGLSSGSPGGPGEQGGNCWAKPRRRQNRSSGLNWRSVESVEGPWPFSLLWPEDSRARLCLSPYFVKRLGRLSGGTRHCRASGVADPYSARRSFAITS